MFAAFELVVGGPTVVNENAAEIFAENAFGNRRVTMKIDFVQRRFCANENMQPAACSVDSPTGFVRDDLRASANAATDRVDVVFGSLGRASDAFINTCAKSPGGENYAT